MKFVLRDRRGGGQKQTIHRYLHTDDDRGATEREERKGIEEKEKKRNRKTVQKHKPLEFVQLKIVKMMFLDLYFETFNWFS